MMDRGDWRTRLEVSSRQKIVNKIIEILKRHLPFSGEDGMLQVKKIAIRFEEKIYCAANSQSDYLRKISMRMLNMMENGADDNAINALQPYIGVDGNNA